MARHESVAAYLIDVCTHILLAELPERDEVIRLDLDILRVLGPLLLLLSLLSRHHLGVSRLRVMQKDLLDVLLLSDVAHLCERLQAACDSLLRVLVDRRRGEV